MEQISRIGMDTSKRFFQLHGVSAAETVVLRKKLRRKEMVGFFEKLAPTVVGIEACGASHHWARLLQSFGHTVKLIPAQLVKPYVKRGKNDMADAEALCEAMSRPTMRFVPIKTADQQAALMLVGLRDRLIRNRTQLSNAIRGYAAEFGLTAANGLANLRPLLERIQADEGVPDLARELFGAQAEEYAQLEEQIAEISAKLMAWHKSHECSRRLAKIPGIGPIGAALLMMKTPAPELFRSGRQFAAALLKEADSLVGDEAGFLVIDDTALPKKGCHSVGVAPQYASSLGKTANCQSLVSVTLASREVPVMVGLRLFLPESWTDDSERMARAGVPTDRQTPLTKPEIAVEEVDRVIASGARFGCVLADSGYGSSGPFRRALSERGLLWAAGLSRRQNVYPADVTLIFPVAKSGKPRKYHIPDQPPVSAEVLLAVEKWQRVSWRRGTEGRLTCLFAARRVRVADGHKHRMRDNRMQCMPGDEVWLVGERRSTGEQKYYVSNLPADASLKMLAATIKARWVCEQAHQQLKEELGLDHFEGRSWTGLHRHALMTMIAYAFLQSRRLKAAGRKNRIGGPPPQPSMPAIRQAIFDLFARPPPRVCPHCEKLLRDADDQEVPK